MAEQNIEYPQGIHEMRRSAGQADGRMGRFRKVKPVRLRHPMRPMAALTGAVKAA
jgi:hypothetical protein